MAHFAQIDSNNIVLQVIRVNNSITDSDDIFTGNLGLSGTWIQTSYNTRGGVHYAPNTNTPDDGTPIRKNYASIGYTYDSVRDAFIAPQPYPSWTLGNDTCLWSPPSAYPTDGNPYIWNETTLTWDLRPPSPVVFVSPSPSVTPNFTPSI